MISLEVRHISDARYTTHDVSPEEMRNCAETMIPKLLRHPTIQIILDGLMVFFSQDDVHST